MAVLKLTPGIKPSSFRAVNDVLPSESPDMARYAQNDYEGVTDDNYSYFYFIEHLKEIIHAIKNQKDGMNVRLRNNIDSSLCCMLIAQGIYLSNKLGRPVTRKEIIDDSMLKLTNPSAAE